MGKRTKRNRSQSKFVEGKKIYSIHSVTRYGTRVPDGPPGNHRPLLRGESLAALIGAQVVHTMPEPLPKWVTWTSAGGSPNRWQRPSVSEVDDV